ncbi:MAG: hydroxysqualene dehydroxylase HpnE [Deltaproteobacteria bacterium]
MNPDAAAIVVGGGVAGIAAALHLADAGLRVALVERRPFLGGRAFSFSDKNSGMSFDNGQHALLGCYHEMIAFLTRIGAADRLYRQRGIEVELREAGGRAFLAAGRAPAPFHLGRALLSFTLLTPRERLRAARGALSLVRRAHGAPVALAGETVEEALVVAGQSARIREVLWYPLALAALNDDPRIASATLFAAVIERAFFGRAADAAIVLPAVPLSELIAEPARIALARAGVELVTGGNATAITLAADGSVSGLRCKDGSERGAAAIVLTLTPSQLAGLQIGALAAPDALGGLPDALFETAPIVSVHVPLPAPAALPAVTGLLGTTTQWVFNADCIRRDRTGPGGLLSCVISGARGLAGVADREVARLVEQELHDLLPEVEGISAGDMHIVRELHATMAPTIAAHAARPPVETRVAGLFLAGDWVQTGLPATLESAALSGRLAAEACCRQGRVHAATRAA